MRKETKRGAKSYNYIGLYHYVGLISERGYIASALTDKDAAYPLIPVRLAANRKISARLVMLKRIPQVWSKDMQLIELGKEGHRPNFRLIGEICYCIPDYQVAESYYYFPRDNLKRGHAKGIPYFIEAMTTCHLKGMGYKFISTSPTPNTNRKKQLGYIGLPVKEMVSIDAWLKGLGRGIRCSTMDRQTCENISSTS